MKLFELINTELINHLNRIETSIVFGQNIIAGSRISGLGKNIENARGCTAFNSTNSENSLIGMGYGVALTGINSFYLMKQHDFSLLGLDHLVNTTKLMRKMDLSACFTLLMVVVDNGYEGPQSNLNNLNEFASLTTTKVHLLDCALSTTLAFRSKSRPLRIFAISQNGLKREVDDSNQILINDEFVFEKNSNNIENKVVVINFGLYSRLFEDLKTYLHKNKVPFHTFRQICIDLVDLKKMNEILLNIECKKIIVCDTSKSRLLQSKTFVSMATLKGFDVLNLSYDNLNQFYRVDYDEPIIDFNKIDEFLNNE